MPPPHHFACLARSSVSIRGHRPRIEEKKDSAKSPPLGHTSDQPPAGPACRVQCVPEPLSMRLRTPIPVPRTSSRKAQKPPPPPPPGNPRKTQEKPKETQEKPTETQGKPGKPGEPGIEDTLSKIPRATRYATGLRWHSLQAVAGRLSSSSRRLRFTS